MKELPQRITITGELKNSFKTKADFKKYAEEHGENFHNMSCE